GAPGLLLSLGLLGQVVGLLAAVTAGAVIGEGALPLAENIRVRREIVHAVFAPFSLGLNGILEREAIVGAQVERHVRHASLRPHPGAAGILPNLAENVEFLLPEAAFLAPLEIERVQGPGGEPILVAGPLVDVNWGCGD